MHPFIVSLKRSIRHMNTVDIMVNIVVFTAVFGILCMLPLQFFTFLIGLTAIVGTFYGIARIIQWWANR